MIARGRYETFELDYRRYPDDMWPGSVEVAHSKMRNGTMVYMPRESCHDVSREAGRFECSGCGATVDVEDENGESTVWKGGYPQVLRFCPCCGARVVGE